MLRPGKRKRFTAPALAGVRPPGSAFAPPAKREAPAVAPAPAAAPVAATPAQPAARAGDSQEPLYFTVLYAKYAPSKLRKNKTWMDGVLEVRPGRPSKCVLFEDSSRQLAASKLSGSAPGDLGPGSEVLVGGWELEVQERQPRDRFLSGDLFDGATGGGSGSAPVGLPSRPPAPPRVSPGSSAGPPPGGLRAFRAPLPGSAPGSAPGGGRGAPPAAARPPGPANPFAHLPHDPRAPGALCLWHRGEGPETEDDARAAFSGTHAQAREDEGKGKEGEKEKEREQVGLARKAGTAPPSGERKNGRGEGGGEKEQTAARLEALLRRHPPAAVVDPHLSRRLLPHQREGVSFLFRCVSRGGGAILADEMGLGKTLQAIALLWTLLKQGGGGQREGPRSSPCASPCIRKALVVAPTTLVRTWAVECRRWLGSERLRVRSLDPGPEAADAARDFARGRADAVLLASYEMARTHAHALKGCVGLLICDEAHRLKASGGSKSLAALAGLGAPRRVLLTGTPAQNAPKELFALAEFASPGALGSLAAFERLFGRPIERARDRAASPEEVELGRRRGQELARRVAGVVLRRTAEVQERLLPPCVVRSLFCALSERQTEAYVALLCGEDRETARKMVLQRAEAKRGDGRGGGDSAGRPTHAASAGHRCARSVVFRGRGVSSRGPGRGGAEALSLLGRLRRICIDASLEAGEEEEEGGGADGAGDDESDSGAGGQRGRSEERGRGGGDGEAESGEDRGAGGGGGRRGGEKEPGGAEEGRGGEQEPGGAEERRGGEQGARGRKDGAGASTSSSPLSLAPSHPLLASSSKLRVLASIARAALSSDVAAKIVVVSQYVSALDLAAELFAAMGVGCVRLDGSTPARLRAEAVERFQRPVAGRAGMAQVLKGSQNPSGANAAAPGKAPFASKVPPPVRAFLLSTSAGGVGLTLTAASTLVLLDPHWNPALDAQAMARIWRPGQTRACRIYRLFAAGSIDEKILQRQIRKGEVAGGLGVRGRKDREVGDPATEAAPADPASAPPTSPRPPPAPLLSRASELAPSLFPLPSSAPRQGTFAASLGQFSDEELKELFTFRPDVTCETRDILERSGRQGCFRDEREEHGRGAAPGRDGPMAGMLGDDDAITAAAREGGGVRFVHVDEIKGNADALRA